MGHGLGYMSLGTQLNPRGAKGLHFLKVLEDSRIVPKRPLRLADKPGVQVSPHLPRTEERYFGFLP